MNNFHLLMLKEWDDFYPDIKTYRIIEKQTSQIRETASNDNVFIRYCIFEGMRSNSDGGCIYWVNSPDNSAFLVESVQFLECTTYGSASAIYCDGSAHSVVSRMCGVECVASGHVFNYIATKDDDQHKNEIYEISIRKMNTKNIWEVTQSYGRGKFKGYSLNITQNAAFKYAGFFAIPSPSENGIGSLLNYSSFFNNTCHESVLFEFEQSATYSTIKMCNVIGNTQKKDNGFGLVTILGHSTVDHCCLLTNNAPNVLCSVIAEGNYLMIINDCAMDFEESSIIGNKEIRNPVASSFINAVSCFATYACSAKYDQIGELTAEGLTPEIKPTSDYKLQFKKFNALIYSFTVVVFVIF